MLLLLLLRLLLLLLGRNGGEEQQQRTRGSRLRLRTSSLYRSHSLTHRQGGRQTRRRMPEARDPRDDCDGDGDEGRESPVSYFLATRATVPQEEAHLRWDEAIDETGVNYLESETRASRVKAANRRLFPEVYLLLHQRFSVILYGFGSKRNFLNVFAATFLQDEHFLQINGYFPSLSAKDVAVQLQESLEADSSDLSSILEAVDQLDDNFYLVIHSIDMLFANNSSKIRSLILETVIRSQGSIRLIATVDHVNSGLLFSSTERAKMDLTWIHVPTFNPYTIERGYLGSSDAAAGDGLSLASVVLVYESLTPNAQKIFLQILDFYVERVKRLQEEKQQRREEAKLARKQKQDRKRRRGRRRRREEEGDGESVEEDSDTEGEEGETAAGTQESTRLPTRTPVDSSDSLPFAILYRICREQYLVNSEVTLKAQLIEFQDHDIMKVAKASDGTPVVRLLIHLDLAKAFLNRIRDV